VQYSTRLNCLLRYYLNSRVIGENYQRLLDLLGSDRIKEDFPTGMRYHISDKEGMEWFSSACIAQLADLNDSDRGHYHDSDRGHYSLAWYPSHYSLAWYPGSRVITPPGGGSHHHLVV